MEEKIHFLSYEPSIVIFNSLFIKFLTLLKDSSDTRADRHFAEENSKKPLEANTPIWYKQFNQWLPGILWLLGRGYSLVVADGEEIWVPLHHIRYWEGPREWTTPTGDAADAKGLVNDHRGAKEKTSTSEPLPDMGLGEKRLLRLKKHWRLLELPWLQISCFWQC